MTSDSHTDRHVEPPKHGAVNETAKRRRVAALVECPICHGPCQEADLAPAADRHTEPDGPADLDPEALERLRKHALYLGRQGRRLLADDLWALVDEASSDAHRRPPAQEQRT